MECPICNRELDPDKKDYYGHILAVHGGSIEASGQAEKPAAIAVLLKAGVKLSAAKQKEWDVTHSPGVDSVAI
jgi:hypothetical protein